MVREEEKCPATFRVEMSSSRSTAEKKTVIAGQPLSTLAQRNPRFRQYGVTGQHSGQSAAGSPTQIGLHGTAVALVVNRSCERLESPSKGAISQ
jgi:hypothetical protein